MPRQRAVAADDSSPLAVGPLLTRGEISRAYLIVSVMQGVSAPYPPRVSKYSA